MVNDIMFVAVGLAAGIISGLLGIGGAIFMIPVLVFFFGMSQHVAQGTTLAMMLPPVTILAVMTYYKNGNMDWKISALLCLGFFFGSYFGAQFATAIHPAVLKKIFGFVLLIAAVKMILGK
ncbi:MAG: sulfite exporter TauE/SafE family protein [Sedimentisphaeraceae bacterium JB056]